MTRLFQFMNMPQRRRAGNVASNARATHLDLPTFKVRPVKVEQDIPARVREHGRTEDILAYSPELVGASRPDQLPLLGVLRIERSELRKLVGRRRNSISQLGQMMGDMIEDPFVAAVHSTNSADTLFNIR